MDDELVSPSPNETSAKEIFWTQLPTYLAIGMSTDEFWHGEPRLAVAYREAAYIKHDNQLFAELRQGRYVYEALLRAAPMLNAMAKDHTPIEYPEEPIFRLSNDNEERNRQIEKAQMDKNKARMEAFAVAHNMKLEQDG